MSERIQTANLDDYMKMRSLDNIFNKEQQNSRIFHFGIVVNNNDPNNINRIKVRIPLLDDEFYLDRTNDQGNELLPWSLPMNRNLLSVPETNSIVIVAIFEPKNPNIGRMYFDAITNLSRTEIFDETRLVPEKDTYNNWDNIEKALNIRMNNKPKNANEYNTQENIKYDLGIKGKGNNLLLLRKESIEILQNKGNKQSKIFIDENIVIESSDILELLSKKGKNKYHPVFDKPLYDYLNVMNNTIKAIITCLNSQPSLNSSSMAPNLPSPQAIKLMQPLTKMYTQFNKLKQPGQGASKQININ